MPNSTHILYSTGCRPLTVWQTLCSPCTSEFPVAKLLLRCRGESCALASIHWMYVRCSRMKTLLLTGTALKTNSRQCCGNLFKTKSGSVLTNCTSSAEKLTDMR